VGEVPAWWQLYNIGSCRPNSIYPGLPPIAPAAPCAGNQTTKLWSAGPPSGGIIAYQTTRYPPPAPLPAPAPSRFRIKMGYATASGRTAPLVTTQQYNTFNLTIDTYNSAIEEGGVTTPCAGCDVGVSLVLSEIYIVGAAATETITAPLANTCITWQGGANNCYTAARNSTWGQVKSLYR
jgi:hypothetical protein